MIDLHTHSLFSDGALIPSELIRRLEAMGYQAAAITDHVDSSNLDHVVPRIVRVAEELNHSQTVKVIPGVELTHVPPVFIPSLVRRARDLGARLVVIHGETIVEPVAQGTNRVGIEAGADIIAHPGLIRPEEVTLAASKGVFLEISARKGHSLTNGHVAKLAQEAGARLVLNSDGHAPGDYMTEAFARKVTQGAGLAPDSLQHLLSNSRLLLGGIGFPF
ncbi:MAG: histidinol phosphate phosphatase domain-containing protein [Desulfobacterota bacterium]|jgi:histidinol phosphatase-like PHP family hydrolase|nr:histidinol phosphate phosphatase domain-containing protein [Thermodesulfobacteriota bacterium]